MIKAKLLLFDIDGTLVDSRQDITTSVNLMLKDLNLPQRRFDEVVSFIGSGVNSLINKSMGAGHEDKFNRAWELFEFHYSRHITDSSTLYPGVEEVLDHYENRELYVITNRQKELADITLEHLKVHRYFKGVFGGNEKECLKPSPCSINRVLSKTSINKDDSVIIGDMDVDIMAGKNAGIKTCAVTYGLGRKDDLIKTNPDCMIDKIIELKRFVG